MALAEEEALNGDALVAWFRANARNLPWRSDVRDPYRTWVSEAMLQQTRVDTVVRYYDRFLAEFPTIEALADADEERLMKAWEGLGYYRRARLLHAGAKAARNGVPSSFDELLALPGMGPYTAGAVGSLAFGLRVPAVDGNVERVFARQEGVAAPKRRDVEAWVMRHQPREAPGAFNEALMELGATVCTPREPKCGACPIRATCQTTSDAFPEAKVRSKPRDMEVALAFVSRGDKLLLERRDSGLLAGTWGLPWVEGGADALEERVEAIVGARVVVGEVVAEGTHVFTHRKWAMRAFAVETTGKKGDWLRPSAVALASAHKKILASLVDA